MNSFDRLNITRIGWQFTVKRIKLFFPLFLLIRKFWINVISFLMGGTSVKRVFFFLRISFQLIYNVVNVEDIWAWVWATYPKKAKVSYSSTHHYPVCYRIIKNKIISVYTDFHRNNYIFIWITIFLYSFGYNPGFVEKTF